MVKTDCLNPSHGGKYQSCGTVSLLASGGMDKRYDAPIRPALEPAFKEKEVTNGAPTDGATIRGNLGMAFIARAIWSRSGNSNRGNHDRPGVWEVHMQGEVPQELVPDDEVDLDRSRDFA